MPTRTLMLRGVLAATATVALALVGCGGSDSSQEASATYPVALAQTSFPARQQLAEHVALQLGVRNTGSRTIPNVTVTLQTGTGPNGDSVEAFGSHLDGVGLASHSRPIWIVDSGPGDTAFANTWALGSIKPGATRTFTWHVVPVRAGHYRLRYRLTGSTTGRSQLRLEDGDVPHGAFSVDVDGAPATVRVTPDGRIVSVQ
ncbi:MAG TPA: hypothetical protein VFV85_05000 [Conexibacter sp.]|nr:hypothetical protein [Conexibacter sp.]